MGSTKKSCCMSITAKKKLFPDVTTLQVFFFYPMRNTVKFSNLAFCTEFVTNVFQQYSNLWSAQPFLSAWNQSQISQSSLHTGLIKKKLVFTDILLMSISFTHSQNIFAYTSWVKHISRFLLLLTFTISPQSHSISAITIFISDY